MIFPPLNKVGDEIKIYRPVPIEEALAVLETTDSTPNTGFLSTGAPSRRQLKGRRI